MYLKPLHVEKLLILMLNTSIYNIYGQVQCWEKRGGYMKGSLVAPSIGFQANTIPSQKALEWLATF